MFHGGKIAAYVRRKVDFLNVICTVASKEHSEACKRTIVVFRKGRLQPPKQPLADNAVQLAIHEPKGFQAFFVDRNADLEQKLWREIGECTRHAGGSWRLIAELWPGRPSREDWRR